MKCPNCDVNNNQVIDSRHLKEQDYTRRRRECLNCNYRFTTYERHEDPVLSHVIKRDSSKRVFDRNKLLESIRDACIKRPISNNKIDEITSRVVKHFITLGGDPKTEDIASVVQNELLHIDDVACVRYASHGYRNLDDFYRGVKAIKQISQTMSR